MAMTNKEQLQHWFDEVWGKCNFSVMDEVLAPDFIAHGILPSFGMKQGDLRELILATRNLLTGLETEILQCVEEGDMIAARLRFTARRTDTGEPVSYSGQIIARFENGMMKESFNQIAYFSVLEQLGQLPPDALAICFTGQRLTWA